MSLCVASHHKLRKSGLFSNWSPSFGFSSFGSPFKPKKQLGPVEAALGLDGCGSKMAPWQMTKTCGPIGGFSVTHRMLPTSGRLEAKPRSGDQANPLAAMESCQKDLTTAQDAQRGGGEKGGWHGRVCLVREANPAFFLGGEGGGFEGQTKGTHRLFFFC